MAACRPRALPHQLLQQHRHRQSDPTNPGLPLQGLPQQSHYSPQLLNWVYLTIADQNQPQQPQDQESRTKRTKGPFPMGPKRTDALCQTGKKARPEVKFFLC